MQLQCKTCELATRFLDLSHQKWLDLISSFQPWYSAWSADGAKINRIISCSCPYLLFIANGSVLVFTFFVTFSPLWFFPFVQQGPQQHVTANIIPQTYEIYVPYFRLKKQNWYSISDLKCLKMWHKHKHKNKTVWYLMLYACSASEDHLIVLSKVVSLRLPLPGTLCRTRHAFHYSCLKGNKSKSGSFFFLWSKCASTALIGWGTISVTSRQISTSLKRQHAWVVRALDLGPGFQVPRSQVRVPLPAVSNRKPCSVNSQLSFFVCHFKHIYVSRGMHEN